MKNCTSCGIQSYGLPYRRLKALETTAVTPLSWRNCNTHLNKKMSFHTKTLKRGTDVKIVPDEPQMDLEDMLIRDAVSSHARMFLK